MSHQVFISYSTQSQRKADTVYELLKQSGVPCWMAPYDIPPAESWLKAIMRGIKECEVLILLLCGHSKQSKHVLREVERADHYKKKILTVRLEDITPDEELEFLLSLDQWLDAHADPLPTIVPRIAQMVTTLAGSAKASSATVSSDADPLDTMPLNELVLEGLDFISEETEKLAALETVTPREVGRVLDTAIHYGAPAYNRRSVIGCAEIYWTTSKSLLAAIDFSGNSGDEAWSAPFARFGLQLRSIQERFPSVEAANADDVAWSLRHVFDRFHTARGIQEVGQLLDKIQETSAPIRRDLIQLTLLLAIQHGNWVFQAKDLDGCAELHHYTATRVRELLDQPSSQAAKNADPQLQTLDQDVKKILKTHPAVDPETSRELAWELYQTFLNLLQSPGK